MPEPISFDACEGDAECERALVELYAYLDGELTVTETLVIRTHLDVCFPCGDRYTFETELRQVVSRRCRDKAPDALRDRIATALLRELEGR